jgi:cytosine/adenosine deaminase-related metal-dependent hydrolase
LQNYGLLKSDILISHASQATRDDREILTAAGVYVSVTPETESQMGLGLPAAFCDDMPVSLGVDCHITGPADLPYQMRLALQLARQAANQPVLDANLAPVHIPGTSMQAFNLGTVAGARAVKMEDKIGSLAEGKLADIVIFDATSPGMICGAQKDPVTAIVRHASIRDIDAVIIDGVVRKLDGKLMPVNTDGIAPQDVEHKIELGWGIVASQLAKSREKIDSKISKLDMSAGAESMIELFGIDKSKLVGWDSHIHNKRY